MIVPQLVIVTALGEAMPIVPFFVSSIRALWSLEEPLTTVPPFRNTATPNSTALEPVWPVDLTVPKFVTVAADRSTIPNCGPLISDEVMTVAVLLGSTLGLRYPAAFARAGGYVFYAVLGIAAVAWPLSYAYCWNVRILWTAVDLRSGTYYISDDRRAGFSCYVKRFDGTRGTGPHIPAWMPALVLSYDIWLNVQNRRRKRREAIAQPARPGGAGG